LTYADLSFLTAVFFTCLYNATSYVKADTETFKQSQFNLERAM